MFADPKSGCDCSGAKLASSNRTRSMIRPRACGSADLNSRPTKAISASRTWHLRSQASAAVRQRNDDRTDGDRRHDGP
jgi:hypothetical protein